MLYVGIDLHKEKVYGIVMNENGKLIKKEKFENEPEKFHKFLKDMEKAIVAIESTGFATPIYDFLKENGYETKVAHPLKTRAIAEAKIKTDKIDAKILADLLRSDLLPSSYIPSKEIRKIRDMTRHRAYMVRFRTRLKNKIHAELAKRWIKTKGNIFTKNGIEWLRSLGIESINRYLDVMEILNEKIREISLKIKEIAKENEDAKLLMTIPGINYYSAMLILAEIGDVKRFPDSHKLCAYAGLVPSTYQSGNKTYHGHITKQGNKWLRWILIQCVHIHIKYDTHLTRFYKRIARRRGKKIAVVATASKMLRVIYQMLINKEEFKPFPVKSRKFSVG